MYCKDIVRAESNFIFSDSLIFTYSYMSSVFRLCLVLGQRSSEKNELPWKWHPGVGQFSLQFSPRPSAQLRLKFLASHRGSGRFLVFRTVQEFPWKVLHFPFYFSLQEVERLFCRREQSCPPAVCDMQ